MEKKRILTGDRTTGRLHLGHYAGSLRPRVRLQNEYDTFILLADVQALTTHFGHPEAIRQSILDMGVDNLSVGLDPEKVTFVQQSRVSAIAELTAFYAMLVPVNVLRHNPTVKTEAAQYGYKDLTYGFLGYPVSQTADITFCGAGLVPVGEDQLPHIELSRKIARRFNVLYGHGAEIITVPEALLSDTPRLPGLDGGGKMGKSLGNAIYLSDDSQIITAKINTAVTDTHRIAVTDKGTPDLCVVSRYHKAFNPEEYDDVTEMCKNAAIGCVACKKRLIEKLNQLLAPIRDKRRYYEAHEDTVKEIIREGTAAANRIGGEQMDKVKAAMNLEL